MRRGKLIVIEGIDSVGKNTQAEMLAKRLNEEGIISILDSYPKYDSPTGRIIGGPILGKEKYGESFFKDPAGEDWLCMSYYYAADRRRYSLKMEEILNSGKNLILDRYVESNSACQGGKAKTKRERFQRYKTLERFEYEISELPRPDLTILLHAPFEVSQKLKALRNEKPDKVESSETYLKNSKRAYFELADIYGWSRIDCSKDNKMRDKKDIHEEVYYIVRGILVK